MGVRRWGDGRGDGGRGGKVKWLSGGHAAREEMGGEEEEEG